MPLMTLEKLRSKLVMWIDRQKEELDEFEDRNESEAMYGSLEAFEAVLAFIDTGKEPVFMTLKV